MNAIPQRARGLPRLAVAIDERIGAAAGLQTRIAVVAALLGIAYGAVLLTHGAAGPAHHLAYPPIVVAAYLFGVRGALVVVVVVAFISGPFPILAHLDIEHWPRIGDLGAFLRVAVYAGIACVAGVLFDRLRAAVRAWESATAEVVKRSRDGMIAVARAAEAKDTDTGDHIVRVQGTAERIATAVGLDAPQTVAIGWAAMLHDVGKLHVPDAILMKAGPLTADEWRIMRMHTIWGAEILEAGDTFAMARRVARWHHENFDGSGYPDGIRGDLIPIEARIVRVADAFDAMTHPRPYQAARSVEWAVDQLQGHAGTQFDPDVVRRFIDVLGSDPMFVRASVQPHVRPPRAWDPMWLSPALPASARSVVD